MTSAAAMNYDVPVPSSGGVQTKQYDCALTKGEYERGGGTSTPEPMPQLTDEEKQDILLADHQCKKKATLQLIMSHRTEWERRLMHFQREAGIADHVGSQWIEALEEVQASL